MVVVASRQEIIEALRQVLDPELRISIVDLGMIRDVAVENGAVKVNVALTVPSCPLTATIEGDVKRAVSQLKGVSSVEVQLTSMSKEEREKIFAKLGLGVKPVGKQVANHVIAVTSGKGGVGKSAITGLLAVELRRQGYDVGILDSDITGPSIAKMFGVDRLRMGARGIAPALSAKGIEIVSMHLLLKRPDEPTIWRGPILHKVVTQMYNDVEWSSLDFLLVDVPPGTSDVPLTLYQTFPLDGVIVVATPQDLVTLIVKKAVNMARKMNVTVLGMIENMSYVLCQSCGEKLHLFGPSRGEMFAREMELPFLGALPLDPKLTELCDSGRIEAYESPLFAEIARRLIISQMGLAKVTFQEWSFAASR